ncbi:MAG TPA: SAM-dependent chlorinase/fluorinase [Chthoniobacterales bacterium]|jgi:S-adenosylmethionine hydrolase|nr:SAM-dependent chlorinase/fluorinase [Chthoniobacterales bacterium]
MAESKSVITLLTDFGTEDYFVGAMKGVILSRSPGSVLIDLTHSIPPHDIRAAAFTLNAAYSWFPAGSIHLAVVDPGVGSERRPVLLEAGTHLFVGPDNGIFTLVLDRWPAAQIRHLMNSAYFLPDPSTTFHGRDIFAPVAAALAEGVSPTEFGPTIEDPVRLESMQVEPASDGSFSGRIIHVDHFGNCVTNLPADLLPPSAADPDFVFQVKEFQIRTLARSYSEGTQEPSSPFLIRGSAGLLEVSLPCSSAVQALKINVGEPVRLRVTS